MKNSKNVAIIVAAGSGQRMKTNMPKQFLELDNRPILWYTIRPFIQCKDIEQIYIVVPQVFKNKCENEIIMPLSQELKLDDSCTPHIKCFSGGERRQDSVYTGIQAIEDGSDIVVIHDGVRPFVTSNQISQIIDCARVKKAVIFGIKPRDTIKKVDHINCIKQSIDREHLLMAQTPQAFSYALIKQAHEMARKENLSATDDAMLVEYLGEKVYVEPGHPLNIKITTPEDLLFSRTILTVWPPDTQ